MNFPASLSALTTSRVVAGGAVAALLAVLVVLKMPSAADVQDDNLSRALPVRTVTVDLDDGYHARRSFTGRAIAGQISPLSFERGGRLDVVSVDLGDVVVKGQALAQLDIARLEARKKEVTAELEETRANLELAGRTLTRARDTFAKGHASAQRLDEAEANAIALQARERRLVASLETLDVDIDNATIKAPYAGVITARGMDEGAVVAAGTRVLEITQTGPMEAHIGMPPEFATAISEGAPVTLYDNRRSAIEGVTVRKLVPVITGQTRTMMVTFNLPEGSVARGELINAVVKDWEEQTGTWLPLRALSADVRGLWRVYKVQDGPSGPHVRFENVQVLYTEANRVFVTGTLSEGDVVIADGISRLAPGQRVELMGPSADLPQS